MSPPLFPDKFRLAGVLKPGDLISLRRNGGMHELKGATAAILCLDASTFEYLSGKFKSRKVKGFTGSVVSLNTNGSVFAAAMTRGPGAPAAAIILEELASFGTDRCISIGVAGILADNIAPGDLIIPTEALRDEGTSYHYIPAESKSVPDESMAERIVSSLETKGLKHIAGKVWTTDAPYRETAEEIIHFRRQKALAVDMETSAILAVASALNIRAAGTIVAADSLSTGKWEPPSDLSAVRASLRRLADVSVEVLLS